MIKKTDQMIWMDSVVLCQLAEVATRIFVIGQSREFVISKYKSAGSLFNLIDTYCIVIKPLITWAIH